MTRSAKYINGNYYVTLDDITGTKTYRGLRIGEEFISNFPDSIDLKITNKCSIGCPYCHESSVGSGKSFNLERTIDVLDTLPKVGIELAIGGGDILEDSVVDDCYRLCSWAINNNFFPRLTVNSKSLALKNELNNYMKYLQDMNSIGISIDHYERSFIEKEELYFKTRVYHIIAGIFPPEDIKKLIDSGSSILVLGYKDWGRAKGIPPKYDLNDWGKELKKNLYYNSRYTIGFDNLAIEQLGIRDCMSEKSWKNFYMGNEFTHTMYMDAVSEIFAPTSRDPFRVSWNDMSILEFFNKYKENDKVIKKREIL